MNLFQISIFQLGNGDPKRVVIKDMTVICMQRSNHANIQVICFLSKLVLDFRIAKHWCVRRSFCSYK